MEGRIASVLDGVSEPAEVALYGGNPLGLSPSELDHLFRLFKPYSDKILSFRLSAKPSMIERPSIDVLKKHRVKTIELGIPAFNNTILSRLKRGHTAEGAVLTYCGLRDEGFSMGIQVMAGLPGETLDDVKERTAHVVHLKPAFIRIYPLVVIEDTELFDLYRAQEFAPDRLDQALRKTVLIYVTAWKDGIKTIKMGLTENDVLRSKIAAGPYHPAFGYLVKSEAFFLAVLARCRMAQFTGNVLVRLHRSDIPHLTGLRRCNLEKLKNEGIMAAWAVSDEGEPGKFILESSNRTTSGGLDDALAAFADEWSVSCNSTGNFI
jgi:histone acetyltransferase (RNA polymerase elongator complex component)